MNSYSFVSLYWKVLFGFYEYFVPNFITIVLTHKVLFWFEKFPKVKSFFPFLEEYLYLFVLISSPPDEQILYTRLIYTSLSFWYLSYSVYLSQDIFVSLSNSLHFFLSLSISFTVFLFLLIMVNTGVYIVQNTMVGGGGDGWLGKINKLKS